MRKTKNVNITVPVEVLDRIDKLTSNRSGYITWCVLQELND